jgi:hypothetical protein
LWADFGRAYQAAAQALAQQVRLVTHPVLQLLVALKANQGVGQAHGVVAALKINVEDVCALGAAACQDLFKALPDFGVMVLRQQLAAHHANAQAGQGGAWWR